MRVFISHSSQNANVAQKVCESLEKSGHSCFIAPRDIRSGHEYAEEIIDGIDNSSVMLLLLSEAANSSPHVLREIERAVSKKITIVVYKLEAVELSKSMEYFLMTHQWINEKLDKSYDEIINCINKLEAEKNVETAVVNTPEIPIAAKPSKKPAARFVVPISAACVCVLALVLAFVLKPDNVSAENEKKPEESAVKTSTATELQNNINIGDTSQAQNKQTEPAIPDDTEAEAAVPEYSLGDTVILGEYLGEPIEWRIIQLSEDGKKALVLSDRILTMKAFDAAEGGKYNFLDGHYYWNVPPDELDTETERLLRGDNRWELSNIRTWLNSNKENVKYTDSEPAAKAMSELKNGYNTEAGFLKNFKENELEAILTTSVATDGVVTEDKVFLLSEEELELLDNADVSVYAIPTEAAQEQDTSAWYQLDLNDYGTKDHHWWLRNADPSYSSQVYLVSNSYSSNRILSQSAGLEGFGIRPAMWVDLACEAVKISEQ